MRAQGLRDRIPELLAAGKLLRLLDTVRAADRACTGASQSTRAGVLLALAELGFDKEAEQAANLLQRTNSTPVESAALYRARTMIESFRRSSIASRSAALQKLAEADRARKSEQWQAALDGYTGAWQLLHPNPVALVWAGVAARHLGRFEVCRERVLTPGLLEKVVNGETSDP